MINPNDKPDQKNLAEVLAAEVGALKEYLGKSFADLKKAFEDHKGFCREDMNDVYNRLRALEEARHRINWPAIYGLSMAGMFILGLIGLFVGIKMGHP